MTKTTMTKTTTNSTIEALRALRAKSAASWAGAVQTAGYTDCDYYDETVASARDIADGALAAWDAAIAAVAEGNLERALDELEAARELAAEWGDDSYELKALALVQAATA